MRSPKAKNIDDYIAHAPDATRPILIELRRIFQKASPKLEEAIKWNIPFFVCNGPVGGFAAYSKHVSWGLFKGRMLNDPDRILGKGVMMGGRITSVAEIPPASKLIDLIRQVIALNESGTKEPKLPTPKMPADFSAALKKSTSATKHYATFTPARKWQYINWISKAKRAETRAKRIETAIERISAGIAMK